MEHEKNTELELLQYIGKQVGLPFNINDINDEKSVINQSIISYWKSNQPAITLDNYFVVSPTKLREMFMVDMLEIIKNAQSESLINIRTYEPASTYIDDKVRHLNLDKNEHIEVIDEFDDKVFNSLAEIAVILNNVLPPQENRFGLDFDYQNINFDDIYKEKQNEINEITRYLLDNQEFEKDIMKNIMGDYDRAYFGKIPEIALVAVKETIVYPLLNNKDFLDDFDLINTNFTKEGDNLKNFILKNSPSLQLWQLDSYRNSDATLQHGNTMYSHYSATPEKILHTCHFVLDETASIINHCLNKYYLNKELILDNTVEMKPTLRP